MPKLRLLVTDKCNRSCQGCCNKQWDLANLPICKDFRGYDQILLTGGEPMLHIAQLINTIGTIRKQTNTPIYLYTAKADHPTFLNVVLTLVDGITLTLHDKSDIEPFLALQEYLKYHKPESKSLRLNIFHPISLAPEQLVGWQVKPDMIWIEDCPLPTDETFMRLEKLHS